VSKTNNPMLPIDEIVEEVRGIRRRLWQEAANDVGKLLQKLEQDIPWETIKKRRTTRPVKSERT